MKNFLVLLSVLIIGCKKNETETPTLPKPKKEVPQEELADTAAHPYVPPKPVKPDTSGDTIIYTADADTLRFKKKEFPELYERFEKLGECVFINDPDIIYKGDKHLGDFGCEVGQDEYYVLYAHYLQGINGIKQNSTERKKLVQLYRKINELFGRLNYGGTYFGHQYSRIAGYVEYDIYVHAKGKDMENPNTYPITKQKNLYLASLRQLIADESTVDFETMGQEKIERNKELNKIVDAIGRQITDKYYLGQAQEFQHANY